MNTSFKPFTIIKRYPFYCLFQGMTLRPRCLTCFLCSLALLHVLRWSRSRSSRHHYIDSFRIKPHANCFVLTVLRKDSLFQCVVMECKYIHQEDQSLQLTNVDKKAVPQLSLGSQKQRRSYQVFSGFSYPPFSELFQYGGKITHWEVARECKTDSQFIFSHIQLSFHIANQSFSVIQVIKPSD